MEVNGNEGERIILHNTRGGGGDAVTVAEDLEGVSAIAARENLVAAAIATLGEIWLIRIGVLAVLQDYNLRS